MFAAIASGSAGEPRHADAGAARRRASRPCGGARTAGTPWVLDPVAVGALPVRTALAHELRRAAPDRDPRQRLGDPRARRPQRGRPRRRRRRTARRRRSTPQGRSPRRTGAVVAVSGPVDLITDGQREIRLATGDALLTRVTGGGCALGAVMAAFLGAAGRPADPGRRGRRPPRSSTRSRPRTPREAPPGPASFAVALLDALAAVDRRTTRVAAARARRGMTR